MFSCNLYTSIIVTLKLSHSRPEGAIMIRLVIYLLCTKANPAISSLGLWMWDFGYVIALAIESELLALFARWFVRRCARKHSLVNINRLFSIATVVFLNQDPKSYYTALQSVRDILRSKHKTSHYRVIILQRQLHIAQQFPLHQHRTTTSAILRRIHPKLCSDTDFLLWRIIRQGLQNRCLVQRVTYARKDRRCKPVSECLMGIPPPAGRQHETRKIKDLRSDQPSLSSNLRGVAAVIPVKDRTTTHGYTERDITHHLSLSIWNGVVCTNDAVKGTCKADAWPR